MKCNIEKECYECSSKNTIFRDGYLICLDCNSEFKCKNKNEN